MSVVWGGGGVVYGVGVVCGASVKPCINPTR